MPIGERIREARKALKLTQEQFAAPLAITRGYIASIENGLQEPSESLLRLISHVWGISIAWLKTGQGDMFISPEELVSDTVKRVGERVAVDAFTRVMAQRGVVVREAPASHCASGDPELDRMLRELRDLWLTADEDMKGWIKVQFRRAFPEDVIAEAQKKQKGPLPQASAG